MSIERGSNKGAGKNFPLGFPSPLRGRGVTGEGELPYQSKLPDPRNTMRRLMRTVSTPSPLTPLPQRGEGNPRALVRKGCGLIPGVKNKPAVTRYPSSAEGCRSGGSGT